MVEKVEDLDEIDFGTFTGRSFADLDGDPDWRTWNEDRANAPGARRRDHGGRRGPRDGAIGTAASAFSGGAVALVTMRT